MLFKLASLFAAASAVDLNEVTDDFNLDAHEIWDSYMEKEEEVYNWFEIEETPKYGTTTLNGGKLHYLNVTS